MKISLKTKNLQTSHLMTPLMIMIFNDTVYKEILLRPDLSENNVQASSDCNIIMMDETEQCK